MAKVLGVGGVFFKSPDPKKLAAWYTRWLGLENDGHGVSFKPATMPAKGVTVWAPFAETTKYFAPATREFMFNFVVDDLDEVMAQVRRGGGQQVGKIEEADYGRFGWFLDPDGNKVELWQPK
ncbi:MAG TPA: VOC family protein [Vicinamibacterales bacterium]|nr:VOC family protein [Vicinamibacterales bacterium]